MFDTSPLSEKAVPPESVRFVLALTTFVAIQAIAAAEADPVGADESAYLALLAAGVLASIAVLATRSARELGWTALLAATAVWVVGYGPHRGALVTLTLLAGLVVAAARAGGASGVLGSPGRSVGLALGLQLLARCDLLLPPLLDLRTLVSVAALPAASGVALHVLGRRFGPGNAWVAGAAAFVLSPGWNVTVTLALCSLAAGAVLKDRTAPAFLRWTAATALLIPPMWDPALGSLFVIGALTFLVEGRTSWLLSMAGIAVLVFQTPVRMGTELLVFWSRGLVLVPAVAVAPRKGRHLVLRGAFLGLVAAMLGGGPEVLAGGLALATLGLGIESPHRSEGAGEGRPLFYVGGLQSAWVSLLSLGTVALATYPWVRAEPLETFLEVLGLGRTRIAMAVALVLVVGLGVALAVWRQRWPAPRPGPIVGLASALALISTVPPSALVPIAFEPVVLTSERPVWSQRFPARGVTGGVVDCHLVHGARLPTATPVATLRLRGPDNALLETWELLAGIDTAEWAAARPDVAGIPGFRAPDPWLVQIAPGGGFFSQRFRARFHLRERLDAATLAVRRHPRLPPEVELTIYRLELRR